MRRPLPVPVTVADIVARLGGEAGGDDSVRIERLASLENALPNTLSFLANRRHAPAARASRAGAIVVSPESLDAVAPGVATIATPDPYRYFAQVTQWFAGMLAGPRSPTIHVTATVAADALIGDGVTIGAGAVVDDGASIGEGSHIGAGCHVGAGTILGARTRLFPNVTVYHDCTIGSDVIIHSGTVVGADGFGFAPTAEGWVKIAQLGGVTIGNHVEIGANCCVDRGALDDTVIGDGCKIDNLVQVGHNVRVGEHTAIAGCVGIAGSVVIGSRCMIGGGAGISGHLRICDGVTVSGMTVVDRSISEPGIYTGVFPMVPRASWERIAASLKQLPAYRQALRALQRHSTSKDPQ
jgi:UDP-3-O-[3-hydroxymyristoyl] glucosamine N-acyltransferase